MVSADKPSDVKLKKLEAEEVTAFFGIYMGRYILFNARTCKSLAASKDINNVRDSIDALIECGHKVKILNDDDMMEHGVLL